MTAILLGILMVLAAVSMGVLTQIQIYFGYDMGTYKIYVGVAILLGVIGILTKIAGYFLDIQKLKMKVQLEELIMIRNNPSIPMNERVEEAAAKYCEIYFPERKNTPEHIAEMAKVFKAGVIWLANPQQETLPE